MSDVASIELTRDCEAVQIPVGSPVTLPQGTSVVVTQTLGGTFTIHAQGGLYRVDRKDADALGKDPADLEEPASPAEGQAGQEVDEGTVWETLKTCYDPEIPVNIVDLGLIYDMQLIEQSGGGRRVDVKMTLTAPGCGMGPTIAGDAQQKLQSLAGVADANVELVWDPPWHPSMISESGKRALGIE